MNKVRIGQAVLTGMALLLFFSNASAYHDHSSLITNYEGSKTCRECHEDAVNDLSHALHFRMLGQPQGVYDFLTNKPVTVEKGKGNRY